MTFYGNKRYNSLDGFFKEKFGCKVAKIALNGGFGCPNRDGTKGYGGCIYCSEKLSGDFAGNPEQRIDEQFEAIKAMMCAKWKNVKFMPYFQAGTSTYAPLDTLKNLYEPALAKENVVAFSIATRPDCLPEDVLDYLSDINRRTFLTVELGLQSVSDDTGKRINRGTTYADFLRAYEALRARHIPVCVHLIAGLPDETRKDILHGIDTVGALHPWAVKLHMLHIIKGTVCEKMYRDGSLRAFDMDEYIALVCDELERLPHDIVIGRLTGDGARDTLIAPMWSVRKFEVLNGIDRELVRRDSWQGKYARCAE